MFLYNILRSAGKISIFAKKWIKRYFFIDFVYFFLVHEIAYMYNSIGFVLTLVKKCKNLKKQPTKYI